MSKKTLVEQNDEQAAIDAAEERDAYWAQRSRKQGHIEGIERIGFHVRQLAGKAFAEAKDERARMLRDLANEIEKIASVESEKTLEWAKSNYKEEYR